MAAITSAEALRALYGAPSPRSLAKQLDHIDAHCRAFIALSPFLVLSTQGPDGLGDATPRGDHAGFVGVADEKTLIIPDRPGNGRVDSLSNLVERPGIGLLVVAAKQRCPQALAARGGDRALVRIGHRIAGDRTAARQDLGLGQLVACQGAAISGDVHGLLIGEQPHELVARHARPGADRSDIEMHEGRVRVWIEADAATLQAHPDLADSRRGHVGQVEVHRLAEHVLAVLGDGARAAPQHGVSVGRAIGGHDVERLLGAELALHLPDDIEQARVHADRLVGAPIPQGPVQLLESGGNIAAILLEGDRRLLLRMHVHDGYGARIAVGDGVLRATDAEQERGHREAEQRGAAAGGLRAETQPTRNRGVYPAQSA